MKLFEEIKGENCIFKCDEEIKGGHSAYELERSSKEWGWDCGECNLEEQRERERERILRDTKWERYTVRKRAMSEKKKKSFFFFSSCIFKYYNIYLI